MSRLDPFYAMREYVVACIAKCGVVNVVAYRGRFQMWRAARSRPCPEVTRRVCA
jgi:hypothetical protein